MQEIDVRIGDRIKALRERKGWTQRELARASGYSQPAVARWESAERSVRPYNLEKIADALEISMQELLIDKEMFCVERAGVEGRVGIKEESPVYAAKSSGQEEITAILARIENSLIEHGKLLHFIAQDTSRLRKFVSQKGQKKSGGPGTAPV